MTQYPTQSYYPDIDQVAAHYIQGYCLQIGKVLIFQPSIRRVQKQKTEDYHPVSLASVVVKIPESDIRERLISQMEENKHFSEKQFGFWGGRSIVLQMLIVLDK